MQQRKRADRPISRSAYRYCSNVTRGLDGLAPALSRRVRTVGFDAVVMYGVNASDIPSERDRRTAAGLREARRLFYVGVTRPKKHLSLVYQEHHHSPWVVELYQRSQRD